MIEWPKTFRSDDIFLDVGANVVTYTIPAAFLSELLIAIELDPSNVSCLYSNIHYNNVHDKVIIVPVAVSNKKDYRYLLQRF